MQQATTWGLKDVPDQSGKTALITGSNTGIGFATASMLAQKGVEVVLACRSPDKGAAALARLGAEVPRAKLHLVQLDLAKLDSVRTCAAEVNERFEKMDLLINNAGLMMPPLQCTADGFEMQFGTNVLGHFALTGLLMPALQRAPAARTVWLSSVAHWNGRIDFANLKAERGYSKWGAYAQSKLADLMLAYEMERRLRARGLPMAALAAHPGGTQSELARHSAVLKWVNAVSSFLLQSATEGAMPSMRAATDPQAHGGDFFGPAGLGTMSGPAVKQSSSQRSKDVAVAAQLWQVCEQLTGVRWLSDNH